MDKNDDRVTEGELLLVSKIEKMEEEMTHLHPTHKLVCASLISALVGVLLYLILFVPNMSTGSFEVRKLRCTSVDYDGKSVVMTEENKLRSSEEFTVEDATDTTLLNIEIGEEYNITVYSYKLGMLGLFDGDDVCDLDAAVLTGVAER